VIDFIVIKNKNGHGGLGILLSVQARIIGQTFQHRFILLLGISFCQKGNGNSLLAAE
jgi:hypothetical protein